MCYLKTLIQREFPTKHDYKSASVLMFEDSHYWRFAMLCNPLISGRSTRSCVCLSMINISNEWELALRCYMLLCAVILFGYGLLCWRVHWHYWLQLWVSGYVFYMNCNRCLPNCWVTGYKTVSCMFLI